MKVKKREVYGFGSRFPTRRFPSAAAVIGIFVAAVISAVLWS